MAITIHTTPSTYYSVNGDMIWVISDVAKATDPTTYPNYKYVADIYINATLIARVKKVPLPETYMGVFNLSDIIRNYIDLVFNPTSGIRVQEFGAGEFFVDVTVNFGEEHGYVTYPNLQNDSARKVFNHYNGRLVGQLTNLSDYTNKPASNRPETNITGSGKLYLPYFPTSTSLVTATITNNFGTVISPSFTPSAAYNMQQLDVSPDALNTYSAGFINTSVTYYTVTIGGVTTRFNIVCEGKYEVYTLHFLNQWGGIESREFTKVSRKVIDIKKSEFGKLPYTVDASGNVSYRNGIVYNDTKTVFASGFREKITLNTDILTDAEYTWLGQLVISPMVYIEVDGYLLPCVISQNNYEYRKQINDRLTNLTLEVQFGETFNAQYR